MLIVAQKPERIEIIVINVVAIKMSSFQILLLDNWDFYFDVR